MKTFKDIKENYNAWGSTNRSALSDFCTHRVEFDEQVFRINTFLENYFGRPILDSVGAFNQLRAKLNIVALDFMVDPEAVKTEGKFEFPVTRHGGSFGTTPDHDLSKGFYKDDGIRGMSMSIVGEVKMEDTGYSIKAKLTQVPDKTDEFKPEPTDRE